MDEYSLVLMYLVFVGVFSFVRFLVEIVWMCWCVEINIFRYRDFAVVMSEHLF